MDPDVVEIPPPIHQDTPPFKRKKKRPIVHDVIDIDDDDNDDDDLMIIGEINRKRHKGKALETIHEGYGDQQVVVCIRSFPTLNDYIILFAILLRDRLILLFCSLAWKKLEQLVGFNLLTVNLQYHITQSMLRAKVLVHRWPIMTTLICLQIIIWM